uniref:DUF4939 domain-containing protein n=1 Tax=Paramormyrops kingsleyae TaxID=1676925 RepID=A0A3B3SLN6_9TELE
MDPMENQRLQQLVDHLTTLVSQLMEARAAPIGLPDSPPRVSTPVPVTMPEKYDGNPDHCQAFLMQCELYVEEHPDRFEETARVRFVISLLTGHAREWATALWMDDSPLLDSRDFQQAYKGWDSAVVSNCHFTTPLFKAKANYPTSRSIDAIPMTITEHFFVSCFP